MAGYNTRPAYATVQGSVSTGYDDLVGRLTAGTVTAIDGPPGVNWDAFQERLAASATAHGIKLRTHDMRDHFRPWADILEITSDSVIDGDPYLAKMSERDLAELVDVPDCPRSDTAAVVAVGPGAALVDADRFWYCDIPKRYALADVGDGPSVLGRVDDQVPDFRRMVFVDWPILDRHRAPLATTLDLFIYLLDPEHPHHVTGDCMRSTLAGLADKPFRTVPHFMPGAWGGHWMQEEFGIFPDEPNLAWSYELIAPEAGVMLGDAAAGVEIPLDLALALHADRIMGVELAEEFGQSFPIRFDYLDTLGGQHLSVHCHPQTDYMAKVFGWPYTQHESYYMMQSTPGSFVYLGLQEGVDVETFEESARRAEHHGEPFEIGQFVREMPSEKHRLFVIPAGTPHGSSVGNVVLEISSTPYFYSLRFYDYLRKDLNGEQRPVHVDHAFANLDRTRRGSRVDQLVAAPETISSGSDWDHEVLCSRPEVFFEIHRSRFETTFADNTRGRFHVLNLVEGEKARIETSTSSHVLHYAETILIPAAVGAYELINEGPSPCMVVRAQVGEGQR